MPFEYFVRPFQTPDAHGRIVIPSAPGGFDQRATLTWGAKTSLDALADKGISVTGRWPNNEPGCCTEQFQEQSRVTTQVKITDSSEPENWILVNRATQLSLDKDRQNACGEPGVWYNKQINASSAAVLKNYETLAGQMGVRQPQEEKCKSVMNLNANTSGS